MNFFIRRPIFAMSIALVMILAGAVCMLVLPIAQYPPLVPPQVQVTTQYIGAGADQNDIGRCRLDEPDSTVTVVGHHVIMPQRQDRCPKHPL